MSTPREVQNRSILDTHGLEDKYAPEALRQFSLRGWTHKPECNETGISCGIRNIVNLGAMTEKVFVDWVNRKVPTMGDKDYPEDGYTYIFSDDVALKNGERVAKMIEHYGLGKLTVSDTVKNPNSLNYIKIWIWHYNGARIKTDEVSNAA